MKRIDPMVLVRLGQNLSEIGAIIADTAVTEEQTISAEERIQPRTQENQLEYEYRVVRLTDGTATGAIMTGPQQLERALNDGFKIHEGRDRYGCVILRRARK